MSQATHSHTTRRSILAGLAAAIPTGFAAASAAASPGADSRLIDLGQQRLALKKSLAALPADFTDEHLDSLTRQLWAVEDDIVQTEARSWAGLLVKLDAGQEEIEAQLSGSGASEPAFADLCETIRRLARIGSAQA
ncbi:hypothetical protein KHP60_04480 [Microvirga sp. 3-52]|uniref:hypothetical protein n=1 Tax=Microvirga sp. 3-52 TaxID=2792425 RepID=UPI001AD24ECB|nr:hypothetical protein [Microvirga sp. 3-52]MBO1903989.1 hypothetical protein [Microvirga sp. 3-52]MBS7451602.1 hypothetical protein [Microvirga sp. 3-52]